MIIIYFFVFLSLAVVSIATDPDDTTTEEVPDLTPDITPCNTDSDYTIKVFKHPTLDSLAIEDTEANTVEVYTWTQSVGEDEETVVQRTLEELSSDNFTRLKRNDYTFIGYTIPSEWCTMCLLSYTIVQ